MTNFSWTHLIDVVFQVILFGSAPFTMPKAFKRALDSEELRHVFLWLLAVAIDAVICIFILIVLGTFLWHHA